MLLMMIVLLLFSTKLYVTKEKKKTIVCMHVNKLLCDFFLTQLFSLNAWPIPSTITQFAFPT